MTYALRHRWWLVLIGVGTAAFVVHGISVIP
jgi:putative Ca2+/H+ antiporter (TMEM165/GDT1 family)